MKIVFVGPSLYGCEFDATGLCLRGPARQGDILAAINDGAKSIGLIDGVFGVSASVWHKEILFALSSGVEVLGASSMGALRAAECQEFGMVPVGAIAKAYASGAIDDDAAVAVTMGPEEFGYPPFVEPLVDVWATVDNLLGRHLVSEDEASRLLRVASEIYFADRTISMLAGQAFQSPRREAVETAYETFHVSAKSLDALKLIATMQDGAVRPDPLRIWSFRQSPFWTEASAVERGHN